PLMTSVSPRLNLSCTHWSSSLGEWSKWSSLPATSNSTAGLTVFLLAAIRPIHRTGRIRRYRPFRLCRNRDTSCEQPIDERGSPVVRQEQPLHCARHGDVGEPHLLTSIPAPR